MFRVFRVFRGHLSVDWAPTAKAPPHSPCRATHPARSLPPMAPRERRSVPLGNLHPATAAPQHLRFAEVGEKITLDLHVLAPDVFRVLVSSPAHPIPTGSWAVLDTPLPQVAVTVRRRRRRVGVETAAARFELDLASGAWQVLDRHGLTVFSAGDGATGFVDGRAHLALDLVEREALFGLGETTGTFNKRGLTREFWNLDVLGHAPAIHPGLRSLYVSVPFALSLRDGRAAGLFWDHPGRQTWDLGQTQPDRWEMRAATGALDLYLFTGPQVSDVLGAFTRLTGRMPLPPRWALGYHQSRYSYETRTELEQVAREFRRRQLPCDALYCDIHHLDRYRVFTFGRRFPRPAEMIRGLAEQGFKVVTIVDPGVKDDPRFGVLRRGRKARAFVKDPSGRRDYLGEVWPGRSRFPDFLNPKAQAWWGEEQRALLRLGVAGLWNDMNEPANFARPDKTLDPRCVHHTEHGIRRHEEVHNAYGLEMARASREGALRHQPERRPFVITRAGYAGIQRHALVWTGDVSSFWEHLNDSVQMCLNLGLSGVPFVGSDVGGFLDHTTPELFVRWLQVAIFTPFLRNHSDTGTIRQEPWAFGPRVEEIARLFLNLRYQLLPYLYGLFEEASRLGTPIMRPLLWHYPNDPVAVACSDEFLLGEQLLVAPILRQGGVARSVYLPRGEWFDFWNGQKYPGGVHAAVEAPLERIPVFVKAGAILPMTATRPFVGAREPSTLVLHVWPDDDGRLGWYDDDGLTQAYTGGAWQRREVTLAAADPTTRRGGRLRFGATEGDYRGHTRTWRVVLRGIQREVRVRLNGQPIPSNFVAELRLQAFDVAVSAGATEIRWR